MRAVIVRDPVAEDDENKRTGDPTGKLRYRTNCVDKVVIEIQVWRWSMRAREWRTQWVDAKSHHVMITD